MNNVLVIFGEISFPIKGLTEDVTVITKVTNTLMLHPNDVDEVAEAVMLGAEFSWICPSQYEGRIEWKENNNDN